MEDETGVANLIVRPSVYQRCRRAARHGVIVLARGRVERQGQVVHILVQHLQDVPQHEHVLHARSRDFH
jgi:error-prone DNA polymerase